MDVLFFTVYQILAYEFLLIALIMAIYKKEKILPIGIMLAISCILFTVTAYGSMDVTENECYSEINNFELIDNVTSYNNTITCYESENTYPANAKLNGMMGFITLLIIILYAFMLIPDLIKNKNDRTRNRRE